MKYEKVLLIPVSLPRSTRNVGATMNMHQIDLDPGSSSSNTRNMGAIMNVHQIELDPKSSSSDKRKLGAIVEAEKVELIPESSKKKKAVASANVKVENVELVLESNSSKGAAMHVDNMAIVPWSGSSNTEHVGEEPRKKRHPDTLKTLKAVKDRARNKGGMYARNHVVKYFDNTDLGYEWLLDGWIAEERFVPTGRQGRGRNYKYYYDPNGNMYYTRDEVFYTWKKDKQHHLP